MAVNFKEALIVLCDHVNREAGTMKATIHGVFNSVVATELPATVNCTVFMKLWVDDPRMTALTAQLAVQRPTGTIEPLPLFQMDFDGTRGRAEFSVNLQGLPVLQSGDHWILLQHAGRTVGRASFSVLEMPHAQSGSN